MTLKYEAVSAGRSKSHFSGIMVLLSREVIEGATRGGVTTLPAFPNVYEDNMDKPTLRHAGTPTTLPTIGDDATYYHRNQQYSIVALTNAAGTLVERYTYSAYGTLGVYDASGTVRTTSTYANRYTYTGREYDPDLNLYHFRARWYDPANGGFISRDPLGYVDGMSLYRGYFGIQGRDYSGMWNCKVGDCEIDAKMTAVRFRFVGYNDAGEVFDFDPTDFDPLDQNDSDVFDPDTIGQITEDLLEKLLKKLLSRLGVGPALRHRLGNLFPTAEVIENWIDRVDLEVGFDVDCTRRDCVDTSYYERWGFDLFCWARGIPVRLPSSKWQESDFDCGGPYWEKVDTLIIETPGNAQDIGIEELVRRITARNWSIVDNLAWSKVVLRMRALDNIPPECTVNVK